MPGRSDTVGDRYLGRMKLNTHGINTNRYMVRKSFDNDQNRLSKRNQRGNQYMTKGGRVEQRVKTIVRQRWLNHCRPRVSLMMKGDSSEERYV